MNEIERLQKELDLERGRLASSEKLRTGLVNLINRKEAEIERLQNERDEWKHGCIARQTDQYRLNAETERLRQVCRDQAGVELSEENDRLIAEIERLMATIAEHEARYEALDSWHSDLRAEIERLLAEAKIREADKEELAIRRDVKP